MMELKDFLESINAGLNDHIIDLVPVGEKPAEWEFCHRYNSLGDYKVRVCDGQPYVIIDNTELIVIWKPKKTKKWWRFW